MTFFAFLFDSKEAWTTPMHLCKPNVQLQLYFFFGLDNLHLKKR